MPALKHLIFLAFSFGFLVDSSQGDPVLQGQVRLKADADQGEALAQIRKAFGKKSVEAPDCFGENHVGVEHIVIEKDPDVGALFKFTLHRDLDGDRDVPRKDSDRQRNEIKGYAGSSHVMKATYGEVARYRWLFRVDQKMNVTPQFCHFFQLKGVGGNDAGDPFFTISGAKVKGKSSLELRHWKGGKASAQRFPIADWSSVRGKWLRCDCLVKYHEQGSFRLSVVDLSGKQVFTFALDRVNTWRDGIEFVRPKWGIYRSLTKADAIVNEQDTVSFADFVIEEWRGTARQVWQAEVKATEDARSGE